MYVVICKDGTTVTYDGGNTIRIPNGETYTYTHLGKVLSSRSKDFRVKKVKDIVEAIDIVVDLHGGADFAAHLQG